MKANTLLWLNSEFITKLPTSQSQKLKQSCVQNVFIDFFFDSTDYSSSAYSVIDSFRHQRYNSEQIRYKSLAPVKLRF